MKLITDNRLKNTNGLKDEKNNVDSLFFSATYLKLSDTAHSTS